MASSAASRSLARAGARAFSAAAAKAPASAAAGSDVVNAFRNMGGLGVWMRDQPNDVKSDMAFFQQAKFKENSVHTYLKRDSDKFWFGGMMGVGMGFGGILCLKGYSDMITGTNKKPV